MLSIEQDRIIESVVLGNNVIVDAVAGSGKTTTSLAIAKKLSDKNILLLTFNAGLKIETRKKIERENITNLEIHSYHSFCVKYYNQPCYDDFLMYKLLNSDIKLLPINYDIIILDEQQDMKPIFFELIKKIIEYNQEKNPQFCLFGDIYQNIYTFLGSDERFLTFANQIFHSTRNWEKLKISQSFRITNKIAEFINKVLLKHKRLISYKEGPEIKYLLVDPYKANQIFTHLQKYIKLGYNYSDIFILAPTIKSKNIPIKLLENLCVKNGFPCYVTINEESKLDDDIINNKIVFTTFHQSKGLERKIVFIYSFDESYYWYAKNADQNICPNILYVATTRASEQLILIHSKKNNRLPFLDQNVFNNVIKNIKLPTINKTKKDEKNKIYSLSVSDLIKSIKTEQILNILKIINIIKIKEEENKIDLPQKIMNEDVSNINGIAIPAYYEYITTGSSSLYNKIKSIHKNILVSEEISIKINKIFSNSSNLEISDFLLMSTIYECYLNGYYFKLFQLKNFDWLNNITNYKKVKKILKNINIFLKSNPLAEYELLIKKNINDNTDLVGNIDCIDHENKIVWEFKAVNYLNEYHYIQVLFYMYIMREKYPEYKYQLLNILTSEVVQIDLNGDIENILDTFLNTNNKNYHLSHNMNNIDFINQFKKIENVLN